MRRLSTIQLNSLIVLALLSVAATRPDPAIIDPQAIAGARIVAAHRGQTPEPAAPSVRAHPYHPEPVTISRVANGTLPDFHRFVDVAAKKRAFYDYMLPMVHEANREVVRERAWLESLAHAMVSGHEPDAAERASLDMFERRYAIRKGTVQRDSVDRVAELLARVDVVPASLIIAQAAKESGWGTSRFARQGNNFFGIWCFYEGCGMLPLDRAEGRNHEVAMFSSVEEGVRYYIRTINTHVAYDELRRIRQEARQGQKPVSGATLANGLVRYSERGLAYVREIQSMIRYNELHRFTRSYSA